MDRKIKIAHFGVGKMGSRIIRFALEKGGELVAAFDSYDKLIGKDVGETVGIDPVGVTINSFDDASRVLKELKPDICTISTKGTLSEMRETLITCVESGSNCIAIGEEAAWPWTTAAEIAGELDALAKKHGVTISASGYPDTYWQSLVLTLAGASESIQKIHGLVIYNVEQYGPHFITGHGVGLTPDEYEKHTTETNASSGYGAQCMPGDPNGWICNALGLTVKSQVMSRIPRFSDKAVWCESFGRDILPGQVLGNSNLVSTETEEGVTIELEVCGKVYAPDEKDTLTWTFSGVPNTSIIISEPDTPNITALSPVNRIPQVINAEPGYITTDRLPPNLYLVKPMEYYVNK